MTGAPTGRVWQALVAGAAGVIATVAGVAVFLPRVVLGEASAGNIAGALLAVAGVALLVLMVWIGFRGRRPLVKALAIPLVFALVQWVLIPAIGAAVATNAPRHAVADAVSYTHLTLPRRSDRMSPRPRAPMTMRS